MREAGASIMQRDSVRTTMLAAAMCIGGLVAGCGGSSSKHHTTPASTTKNSTGASGPLIHTGPVGSIARPTSGTLDATRPVVLLHIDSRLVTYFSSKGLTGVTAVCNGSNPTTASCKVTGTDSRGQTGVAVLTLALAPTTGELKVTHASF